MCTGPAIKHQGRSPGPALSPHPPPPTVPTVVAMVWATACLPWTQSCSRVSLLLTLPFPSCSPPGSPKGVLKTADLLLSALSQRRASPWAPSGAGHAPRCASEGCRLAARPAALVPSCVPHPPGRLQSPAPARCGLPSACGVRPPFQDGRASSPFSDPLLPSPSEHSLF